MAAVLGRCNILASEIVECRGFAVAQCGQAGPDRAYAFEISDEARASGVEA